MRACKLVTAHDVTDLKIKRETPMKYQSAIISCFVWFAATIVCGEPVQVGTDFENESSASKRGDVQTPEIVALTWMPTDESQEVLFWQPDGEILPDSDRQSLVDNLKSYQLFSRKPQESAPLLLIFDVGSEFPPSAGVRVDCDLPNGQKVMNGRFGRKEGEKYLVSWLEASDPIRNHPVDWPENISLTLTFPIEEPVKIRVLTSVPEMPLLLARGVSWSVEPEMGYDPDNNVQKYPAGVLEISEQSLGLQEISVQIFERGSERKLRESYVTIRERNGERFEVRVSDRFPEAENLDRVDIYRQLFRRRSVDVKIKPELGVKPSTSDK